MKTIYLVTEGEYSDYHVAAAFSTEALARDYMDKFDGDNIDEYELDPQKQSLPNGMNVYSVDMFRDGSTNNLYYDNTDRLDELVEPHIERDFYKNGVLTGEVLARDKIHAAKIMNEKRVQLIALGEWKK